VQWHQYEKQAGPLARRPGLGVGSRGSGRFRPSGPSGPFLGSSVVERSAVNRLVAGSNPARGVQVDSQINASCIPFLGDVEYEWIKPPEPLGLLFDPAAGATQTGYFRSKILKPKISLRFAAHGLGAEPLLLTNEASAAEGFSNPRAVSNPSCRAAGFQPALERWPTDLPTACLGGNNGRESPKSREICLPLRFSLILL
jgi:hypothetical protein